MKDKPDGPVPGCVGDMPNIGGDPCAPIQKMPRVSC